MSDINKPPKQVLIVAGEASGEARAARLVEELLARHPEVSFFGIGCERMRAAGVDTLVDCREMAVLGLFEVLRHYRRIKGVLERMRTLLREERPDLLILVDYSGFNLRLAPTAKELGIPVMYYISPQVWAWRQKRIVKIREVVDQMVVVFPFEVPLYEKAGVPVHYVGHPLLDEVHSEFDRDGALLEFGLDPSRPCVGLFPGSRRNELQRLLPTLLDAAERIHAERPEVQFLLPQASTLDSAEIDTLLNGRSLPVTVVENRFYDVARACDAIATASGTATLEIALMEVPLLVVYRISSLSFRIMRRLIKLKHIAMCNIVAGEEVARELLQDEVTAERVSAELMRLLDPQVHAETVERLTRVRETLGEPGGAARAAAVAAGMLGLEKTEP
jgi:lipid-A-disaccharide synthase